LFGSVRQTKPFSPNKAWPEWKIGIKFFVLVPFKVSMNVPGLSPPQVVRTRLEDPEVRVTLGALRVQLSWPTRFRVTVPANEFRLVIVKLVFALRL
jgi:hypothetical protein